MTRAARYDPECGEATAKAGKWRIPVTVAGGGPVQDVSPVSRRGACVVELGSSWMRPLVLALLCAHLAADAVGMTALAQSRGARPPATVRLTCAEAMDLVRREGEVVVPLAAGPERFVRDRNQCDFSEIAELRFVPTRDNPQCPIGYRCREPGFEEWNW